MQDRTMHNAYVCRNDVAIWLMPTNDIARVAKVTETYWLETAVHAWFEAFQQAQGSDKQQFFLW